MEIKNVADLEEAVIKGGYDQPGLGKNYEEITEKFFPERQREAELLTELIPAELVLAGGRKVTLGECRAVDLGSGPGLVADILKGKAKEIVAIDAAGEMVGYLKKKFAKEKGVSALRADMTRIPLADESVEIVVSLGAIFELPADGRSDDKFLSEAVRILKAGGVLILDSVGNADYFTESEIPYSRRNFFKRRAADINRAVKDETAVKQRRHIFLDRKLPDQLAKLGYDCAVESFYNKDENQPFCAVRITKIAKIKK